MGKLQISSSDAELLHLVSTNGNNYIRFNSDTARQGAVGYYGGAAFLSNEKGNYARLAIADNGTPQYWSSNSSSSAKTLLHAGNYTDYTVTKTGSGASGTWSINITGNAATSSIPAGFSYRETSWTWGTLTAANGYTLLTDWITPASGGLAFADKGAQVSCQIDGYFYQNEGRYIVLDANNYTSYAPTKTGSGASGTWGINISGNAATASFASSASLLSIHNTVTNTSTRSVAASSWTGSVSGLKYVWGEAFKDTSIGSDTGDLVLGLRAGQYTSGGTELCVMIDGDYYAMGNKVLHAGNWSSYCAPASHSHSYLPLSGGTVTGTITSTAAQALHSKMSAGSWAYIRLTSGGNYWDVAVNSSQNDGALDFRPNGNNAGCYITRGGHMIAMSGLTWNHAYWTPQGNIYCTPTANNQEWSFDVGAAGYSGCYWHVWSAKNGCTMLQCNADNNSVGIPNGVLYLNSKCYGGTLPSAAYVGQIFFKT